MKPEEKGKKKNHNSETSGRDDEKKKRQTRKFSLTFFEVYFCLGTKLRSL